MSRETKIKCDICKKNIINDYEFYELTLGQSGKMRSYPNEDLRLDVCKDCYVKLKISLQEMLNKLK